MSLTALFGIIHESHGIIQLNSYQKNKIKLV